ncbi:hypothetical protein L6R53_32755 [Myxococcota bacterium]|nr:hypothetical protein [Myxococcota bacterium]
MIPLLLVPGALAADPVQELLAPSPADLDRARARADQLLSQAEAVGLATARAQNAWQALGAAPDCSPHSASLALRAELLGVAWWTRLQSARAELGRIRRAQAAATLQPLLVAADDQALVDLAARADRSAVQYLVAARLQAERLQPWAEGCPGALEAAAGLPPTAPVARDEAALGTAVLLRTGGVLCPDPGGADAPVAVPWDGEVVVLGTPSACWSAGDCACAPAPLLPGAVLGPP